MDSNQFLTLDELQAVLNPQARFLQEYDTRDVRRLILSIRPDDADPEQMRQYGQEAYRRILYTAGLIPDQEGAQLLEIGSNPYKLTIFLRLFFGFKLTLTNFFGEQFEGPLSQQVLYPDILSGDEKKTTLNFHHLNIENTPLPFPDEAFDFVLLSEVIEHLIASPVFALREIKRVLKKDGAFILTTPNACSLDKVYKLICGVNIHDPYHANGLYGRHNREYSRHELYQLLSYAGFKLDDSFTADAAIKPAVPPEAWPRIEPVIAMFESRHLDLGQYIFIKCSHNRAEAKGPRPPFIPPSEDLANEPQHHETSPAHRVPAVSPGSSQHCLPAGKSRRMDPPGSAGEI